MLHSKNENRAVRWEPVEG